MKLYVLIEEEGCIDDYHSNIKLVTSKKKEMLKYADEILEGYKKKDCFGFTLGRYVNSLYIDIWEDGKQLDKSIVLK